MDISGVSGSLLQQVANTSTRNGDAVTVTVMRKAMDIQASQAAQLIESVREAAPRPSTGAGQIIDVKA